MSSQVETRNNLKTQFFVFIYIFYLSRMMVSFIRIRTICFPDELNKRTSIETEKFRKQNNHINYFNLVEIKRPLL